MLILINNIFAWLDFGADSHVTSGRQWYHTIHEWRLAPCNVIHLTIYTRTSRRKVDVLCDWNDCPLPLLGFLLLELSAQILEYLWETDINKLRDYNSVIYYSVDIHEKWNLNLIKILHVIVFECKHPEFQIILNVHTSHGVRHGGHAPPPPRMEWGGANNAFGPPPNFFREIIH